MAARQLMSEEPLLPGLFDFSLLEIIMYIYIIYTYRRHWYLFKFGVVFGVEFLQSNSLLLLFHDEYGTGFVWLRLDALRTISCIRFILVSDRKHFWQLESYWSRRCWGSRIPNGLKGLYLRRISFAILASSKIPRVSLAEVKAWVFFHFGVCRRRVLLMRQMGFILLTWALCNQNWFQF